MKSQSNKRKIKLKNEIKEMTFDEVYNHFYDYINKIADKYCPHENEKDDYRQEAYIELYNAYNTYDIDRNIEFKTYMVKLIKNHLYDYKNKSVKEYKNFDLLETHVEKMTKNLHTKMKCYKNSDNHIKSIDDLEKSYEIKSLLNKSLNNTLYNMKEFNINRNKDVIKQIYKGVSQAEIAKNLNITRATISYIFRQFAEEFKYQYNIVI